MKKIFDIYKTIAGAFALSLMLLSCEKEIDVDLRSVDPRIVIEGVVVNDSLAKVKITKTKDFNDNSSYTPVQDANVVISDDFGNSESLLFNASGWYVAPTLRGAVGRTYKLKVTHEAVEYTSTSKMPPMVPIDSLSMFMFPIIDYPFPRIHFKDPLGATNDYYRKKLYINDKYIAIDNESIEADRIDGTAVVDICFVPENKLVDEKIHKGDRILIELQSIDKGASTFFKTLGEIGNSLNNPTSNITGGALGYFSAYTFDRKEIVADWEK